MLIRRAPSILPSEITSEEAYLNRRSFMKLAAAGAIAGALHGCSSESNAAVVAPSEEDQEIASGYKKLSPIKESPFST